MLGKKTHTHTLSNSNCMKLDFNKPRGYGIGLQPVAFLNNTSWVKDGMDGGLSRGLQKGMSTMRAQSM